MPMGNPSLRAMIDPRSQFGSMGRDSAATAGVGIPEGAMGGPQQAGPGLAGAQPLPPTPAEMQAGGGPMGMIGQGMPAGLDPQMLQVLMILSDPVKLQEILAQLPPEEAQQLMQLVQMLNPGGMPGGGMPGGGMPGPEMMAQMPPAPPAGGMPIG